MGALSINGCTELRTPFEPLVPDVLHVSNTNRYRRSEGETDEEFTGLLLDELEETIRQAGPETVAMVIMEPVQNAGGSFMPPAGYWAGVRELCDRYGILLCADEVITSFGRLGHWFASERFDIRPDMITTAKGLSSAYAAIGALLVSDRVMEPFERPGSMFTHGMTFGGHPVQAAVALKNIEIMRRDGIVANVAERQDESTPLSAGCSSFRSWATCAAAATSTPSSSSRTQPAGRASRTRSATSCCAGSFPPSCSSAA
jgi:adenosylmethionine-8-amino-7-oxononanoate aminotransferase